MLDRTEDGNIDEDNNSTLFIAIGKEVASTLHLMKIGDNYQTANGPKKAGGIGRMVFDICQRQIVDHDE